jgi:Fe-S-cluster containining protein
LIEASAQGGATTSPCNSCGACCSYSSAWPRFTLEDDAALARIPAKFIAVDGSGMLCAGDRCGALLGEVGCATSCGIYVNRPDVCRACEPGDTACGMARARFGLEALALPY